MTLALNTDFNPHYGEAVEVSPGIRRVTAPNAGAFRFHGTNSYLLGGAEVAVIDPGPDDAAHLETLMRAIGDARVTHILLTHRHHDHAALAPRLQGLTGAPILAAIRTGGAQTDTKLDEKAGVQADNIFADGEIIHGPFPIEAVATPGHASDHFVFALPGADVLFSGDHVMGWSTTSVAPPDGSMAAYMASLDRLLARTEHRYFPGHGGRIDDAHAYVQALKAHRRMREQAILEELNRGGRTVAELVARNYPDLDPALLRGAAASTLAHLEDLSARGLVVSGSPPGPETVYRAAASGGG